MSSRDQNIEILQEKVVPRATLRTLSPWPAFTLDVQRKIKYIEP